MKENPYRVMGSGQTVMRGREVLFEDLRMRLTKKTPDHLSVVGPSKIGKTVLLRHLAKEFSEGYGSYVASVYWDVRIRAPRSDREFLCQFSQVVREAIQPFCPILAGYLEVDDTLEEDDIFDFLDQTFLGLQREEKKVLTIIDGFDHLLDDTSITKDLLRALTGLLDSRPSLRMVTGSRKTLRELSPTHDHKTSPLWGLFLDPVYLGPLEDTSIDRILEPILALDRRIGDELKREIIDQTGLVPIVTSALLNRLYEGALDGQSISKISMKVVAEEVLVRFNDVFNDLWDDCSLDEQAILCHFIQGNLPENKASHDTVTSLRRRGYAVPTKGHLKSACRLMVDFASRQDRVVPELQRIFGDISGYGSNIKRLLEIRLAQIEGVEAELKEYVTEAVACLHPTPKKALQRIRGIAEHAAQLVWSFELRNDEVPQEWVTAWQFCGDRVAEHEDVKNRRKPRKMGAQCNLLRVMTGTEKCKPVAKFITKQTALLIDYLQSVGDFGHHLESHPVTLGFVASACLCAVELCECLARELINAGD